MSINKAKAKANDSSAASMIRPSKSFPTLEPFMSDRDAKLDLKKKASQRSFFINFFFSVFYIVGT